MMKFVPYLAEELMERDAEALLTEYAQTCGAAVAAPVPVEDILEKHLKLTIEFDDTHRRFGVRRSPLLYDYPDILGAIFFDTTQIVIDETLDPAGNPKKEGRYRFTVAHEGGHWRLHRHLFANEPAQTAGTPTPSVLCRSGQASVRVELQADFYAACLLMPRQLVMAAWDECGIVDSDCIETDEKALYCIAQPLADRFLVSATAMRIRLAKLGLLGRQVPKRRP
jgi:hypothetical protein